MDPSFLCHFILQQGIDHSMSCGLRLGFESVRSYNHSIVVLLSESFHKKDTNTNLKCVSFEVLPSMALWCECMWESLCISNFSGWSALLSYMTELAQTWTSEAVTGLYTFALMASSSGFEAIIVENGLLAKVNASLRSINKYILFGRATRDVYFCRFVSLDWFLVDKYSSICTV